LPRLCTTCAHPSRRKIDSAIARGASNRTIAAQFRLTPTSVQRHRVHAAKAIGRASERRELSIGENVLEQLEALYQRGLNLLGSAEREKNHFACIGYLRELRGILSGLYQVAIVAAPERATKPMPSEYVAAVCRALGIVGELKPIRCPLPALPPGENGHGDSELEIPILPQD
jgi:hypothetical protein